MNAIEGTIPGPRLQLGRVPKGIISPLLKHLTVLMVRVSWQDEVATSRAYETSDKDEAHDSPLPLPARPYTRRRRRLPGPNLSRSL